MSHSTAPLLGFALSFGVCCIASTAQRVADPKTPATQVLNALDWREVGPYRGGRCAAVTGTLHDPNLYYMGTAGGGVWKTTDSGLSWTNISDGSFGGSIGAVAVAASDPNVIYVGGGEKTLRGNVSHGDGMWKSVDAGRTWSHVGLPDSRHICRIRIHPRDADVVYAAVLGHAFGPNEERGVYRSRDGGTTWQRILFKSENAGAVDLAMDPTNPRILYASLWQVRRSPWSLDSGGPDSGLWKTTDGGETWTDITKNEGLPAARGDTIGICGITVSPSAPDNLYAIVEAEHGGVFRSRDGGTTWKRTSESRDLRQRAWYYSRIHADPADQETVYVLNVRMHKSVDGGRTFQRISTPHGDNHDLWIAPDNPQRMIESNDGGANISHDGGAHWSRQDNQPTAQIYRVSVDNAVPYRLLGGQQDNSAIRIRSRALFGGSIGVREFEPTAGGESGHIVAKPDDPDLVFGGSYDGYLTWLHHRTGERRTIHVWPDNPMGAGAESLRYRFQWNFPLFFSPHDPDTLYAAAQVLFRSTDRGASWETISPDLTRNDKSKQRSSGGPITQDNTSVEYYGTIFTALHSPHEPKVLWAGSDDGRLHVSRDAATSWQDVTPESMLVDTQINDLALHPDRQGTLYVAATRYRLDDFRPLLYRTNDYGQSWTEITNGIDPQHFTRAICSYPRQPGVLFCGTERGVYVSRDDGANWRPMQGDLPVVPITDLEFKDGDLIAATQGRGFWILDEPQRVLELDDVSANEPHLFQPRHAVAWNSSRGGPTGDGPHRAGQNPPAGLVLDYWLPTALDPATELRLEIMTADAQPLRSFTRKPGPDADKPPQHLTDDDRTLDADSGMNRFVWDLRHPSAERFDKMVLWNGNLAGPRAVPGSYRARLTIGDRSSLVAFVVEADPLSTSTADERRAQFEFTRAARDKLTATHRAIRRIRKARPALRSLADRSEDQQAWQDLAAPARALADRLHEIEKALYQTRNESRQDPLNFPIRLNDKLAGLMGSVANGDRGPTRQALEVRAEIFDAIDRELATLRTLLEDELPALNRQARELGIPHVGGSW